MSKIGPFICGGIVGAAIALMFAPQSGDQTRALVSEKMNAAAGEARDWGANAPQNMQDAYRTVQERGAEVVSNVSARGQEFAQSAQERGQQFYNAATQRVQEATGTAASEVADTDELRDKIEAARERIAAQVVKNAEAAQAGAPVDADGASVKPEGAASADDAQ